MYGYPHLAPCCLALHALGLCFRRGARVTVKREGSSTEEPLDAAKADIFPANEKGMMTNDHCALIHLNEPCVLENTRLRFDQSKIYTYTGKILVALNPFAKLSIYGITAVCSPLSFCCWMRSRWALVRCSLLPQHTITAHALGFASPVVSTVRIPACTRMRTGLSWSMVEGWVLPAIFSFFASTASPFQVKT